MTSEIREENDSAVELKIRGSSIRVNLSQGRTSAKLGFLGPPGTFTDEAALKLFGDDYGALCPELLPKNRVVMDKVIAGDLDLALVALENSSEGHVIENLRALIENDIVVLGEIDILVRHMLIGRNRRDVTKVYSHRQALDQCREYFELFMNSAKLIEVDSTAAALKKVDEDVHAGAIVSRRAVEIYNLRVIDSDIQDRKDNCTRFVLVGRGKTEPTGSDSTMMVLQQQESSASPRFIRALDNNGIILNRVRRFRENIFFVVIDGHVKDEDVAKALNELRDEHKARLRVLGSYQKDDFEEILSSVTRNR